MQPERSLVQVFFSADLPMLELAILAPSMSIAKQLAAAYLDQSRDFRAPYFDLAR